MKMGFRTINQFLYEMSDVVEVRTFNGKLFVFVSELSFLKLKTITYLYM